jgi:hypothetical protein
MKSEDFLGLSKKESQNLAEKRNLIFRLIRVDSEPYFAYPDETNKCSERICVEIEGGKVVKATFQ